jgi:hypothetical protein
VGDTELFNILEDLADNDPRANIWDDTDVQSRLKELGVQMNTTPAAMEQPPVEPAAGEEQELKEGHMAEVDQILQDCASGDEDIYRVIEIQSTTTFLDLHKIIFDNQEHNITLIGLDELGNKLEEQLQPDLGLFEPKEEDKPEEEKVLETLEEIVEEKVETPKLPPISRKELKPTKKK